MIAVGAVPRSLRWTFFGLAPIALLAAILLKISYERRDPYLLRVESNRERAIAIARRYIVSLGVPAEGWKAYCTAKPDPDLFRFFRSKPRNEGTLARALAPPVVIQVLFESPQHRHAFVTMSLEERVLGYDIRGAGKEVKGPLQSEAQTLQTATDALNSDPRLADLFARAVPEVSSVDRSEAAVTRVYTWRVPVQPLHELELAFTTSVRNGAVLSRMLKATVDPSYVRRTFRRTDDLLGIATLGFSFYVIAVILYSAVSYGRRATQGEVSHSRTLWMAVITTVLFMSILLTGYDETFISIATQNAAVPVGFVYTLLTLLMMGAALLASVAYGAGEGDVREAYPGKLASLDALVLGKVVSRNVGTSVMIGATFACWFLLMMQVLKMFTLGTAALDELNSVRFPFMRAPWLSFLMIGPASAFLFAVGGLVQPLAFAVRWIRTPRWRIPVVALCAVLATGAVVTSKPSVSSLLVTILVNVPALLVPFFVYDLLASVVSFITVSFVSSVVWISVLYAGWGRLAFWLTLVACLTLVLEFFAWRRGRDWREEEVRPEYARHIAERQALEAEVSAAREAQLRLLPQAPPHIPGLSIFASCLPARVVGGDFYDFFPLSEQRLGIFIAEGGNRGLASALSIALAKGYLMHATQRVKSPTDLILRLEETLGSVLESGVVTATIAYAILDARTGALEYARTGSYPKLVVTSNSGVIQQEHDVAAIPGRHLPITEGRARVSEGDTIVLFTDGVANRMASRSRSSHENWIERLAREHADTHALYTTLFDSIGAPIAACDHELEDDLTAIVIRRVAGNLQTQTAALEGVA
ncbi:MAG: SpoIIE family protein phosphatase [Acidobacteriaceae bacterium]|nr:SpoIIE family protein phosphatase [Acidobacteriaceae bacterium]